MNLTKNFMKLFRRYLFTQASWSLDIDAFRMHASLQPRPSTSLPFTSPRYLSEHVEDDIWRGVKRLFLTLSFLKNDYFMAFHSFGVLSLGEERDMSRRWEPLASLSALFPASVSTRCGAVGSSWDSVVWINVRKLPSHIEGWVARLPNEVFDTTRATKADWPGPSLNFSRSL